MFMQDGSIIHGVFLVGVGVEVASHTFKAVDNMDSVPAFGSLECGVFAIVGYSLQFSAFIAGTGIDFISAVDYG